MIVVGNITVGGSGKTPLVVALARLLADAAFTPAIVSRGYGGTGKGQPALVTPSSDPAHFGDEPVLLARRAACPVWVCSDRRAALEAAWQGGADVVLADDGLQQPHLPRSYEICVIDGLRGLGNGHLLPAGPLRQPAERLAEVDLTVVKLSGPPSNGIFDAPVVPVLPGRPYRLGGRNRTGGDPARETVFDAVCAIGNPDSFFTLLQSSGYRFRPHSFPDHHRFVAAELADLAGPLIVTEKDAVKLEQLDGLPETWVLPIDAQLPDTVCQSVLRHVREFRQ